MKARMILGMMSLALAVAPRAMAEEILYVHNTMSGEISKVAIPEHDVVGEIEIGKYMDFVYPSPDGKTLYVNRIEGMGVPIAPNIGEEGEIIAVDTRTDEIQWRLDIDGMTHHHIVSKDGKRLFVPLYDTWWLAVVDLEKREVMKKIFIGHGGHGTKLSPDGTKLYVGSMMYDTIMIIDTEMLQPIGRIGFPDGVRPFTITNDGKTMYVQLSRHNGFYKVNLETGEKEEYIEMPAFPEEREIPEFYPHNVNHGLLLSKDNKYLYANGSLGGELVVFSHPELDVVARVPVGDDPNSIATSKDGQFIYVSNRGSDDLSIISRGDWKEVKRLPLGKYPQRMAVVDVPDE